MAEILKSQKSYIEVSRFLKAYNQICSNPTSFINPETGVNFASKEDFISFIDNEQSTKLANVICQKSNAKLLNYDKPQVDEIMSVYDDVKTLYVSGLDGKKEDKVANVAESLTRRTDVVYSSFNEYKSKRQEKIHEESLNLEKPKAEYELAKKRTRAEGRKRRFGIFARLALGLAAVATVPAVMFGAIAAVGGFGVLFTMPAFGITATVAAAVYASYKLLAKPFQRLMEKLAKMSNPEAYDKAKANELEKKAELEKAKSKDFDLDAAKAEEKVSEKDMALLKELNDESARFASDHVAPVEFHSEVSESIIDGYKHYRDVNNELYSNLENAFILEKENEIVNNMIEDKLKAACDEIKKRSGNNDFEFEPEEKNRIIAEAQRQYQEYKNIDDEYLSSTAANENIRKVLKNIELDIKYDLDDGNGRQTEKINFDVRQVMSNFAKNETIKENAEQNLGRRNKFNNIVKGDGDVKGADSSSVAKDVARKLIFEHIGKSVDASGKDLYGYPIVTGKFANPEDETEYKAQVSRIADAIEHYMYEDVSVEEINKLDISGATNGVYKAEINVKGEIIPIAIDISNIIDKQNEIMAQEPQNRPEGYRQTTAEIKAKYNDMLVKQAGFTEKAIANIVNKSIEEVAKARGITLTEEEKDKIAKSVISGQRAVANIETLPYSYHGIAEEVDFAAMKNTNEYYEFANELREVRQHVLDTLKGDEYKAEALDAKENETVVLTRKEQMMKDALVKYAASELKITDAKKQEEFVNYVLGSDSTFRHHMESFEKAVVDESIISKGKDELTHKEIMEVVDKALADVKQAVESTNKQQKEADALWKEKSDVWNDLIVSDNKKRNALIIGDALDASVFVNKLVEVVPYKDEDMQTIMSDLGVTDKKTFSYAILKYLTQERSGDVKDANIKPKSLAEYMADAGINCTEDQGREILVEVLKYKEEVLDECFELAEKHKYSKFNKKGVSLNDKEDVVRNTLEHIINGLSVKGVKNPEAQDLKNIINRDLNRTEDTKFSIDSQDNGDIYDKLGDNYTYILKYVGLDLVDGEVVPLAKDSKFGTPEFYLDAILSKNAKEGYVMDGFLQAGGLLDNELLFSYEKLQELIRNKAKGKVEDKNDDGLAM